MKKEIKPGEMFNAFQEKKRKAMKRKKEPEKGETMKHERGESKAFEAKERDKKNTKRKGFAPVERAVAKKRKTKSEYEGSALDRKLDRITGFKEGSPKDEAMDRAIAPRLKKTMCKKHNKRMCKVCK